MPKAHAIAVAVLLSAAAAGASGQEFKREQYNKYSEFAKNGFSEVVTVTGPMKLIFLSGMGSEDGKTGDAHFQGDFLAQCRMAWQKIAKLLGENGATVTDIVKSVVYVTDIRMTPEMRKCRAEFFPPGSPLPAQTLLNVVQLARPGMLVEIDVIAAVPAK
jgi:enamine deaminase RidA (YjgF/YER057c/UK114 family)